MLENSLKQPVSRRQALGQIGVAGTMLTMAGFLEACGGSQTGRLAGGGGDDPLKNAEANGLKTPILKAINCGITAPNPHNTQGWKFLIRNEYTMELFVDEKRLLVHTDPPARQVHIGQGTFLEHLNLGARQMGYRADIKYFPAGEYGLYEIGQKPVARVELVKDNTVQPDPLYKYIPLRATNRANYNGPAITRAEFQKIRGLVGPTHAKLNLIHKPAEMKSYGDLFFQAMALETETVKRADESRIWFRLTDEDIYGKRDGISLRGNGMSGLKFWMVSNFFVSLDKKSFHSKENQAAYLEPFKATIATSKAYCFFRTASNTQADWVRTGRDYARFQLVLTSLGLVMHPLSQILQEYPEMDKLRTAFEKQAGVGPGAKVQMAVRIGRSDYRFISPRRPLKSMLRNS